MYKFFGTPLQPIRSRLTNKVLFVFDTKGEFVTDDEEIINRALGFFDYLKFETSKVGDKIKKTNITPPMTITKTETNKRHCKKCNFECDNQGELLSHYRDKHPKEV